MKAIQYHRFGGPEVLEYVDVPVPSPGAGEVLIETTAVGVNFPDIRERLGIYNQEETRVGGVTLPQIGGVQVVGKVVDTGSGVSADLRGRKVMAMMIKGADAQFAVAQTIMTVTLADDADDVVMASLPMQGTTAYLSLKALARIQSGDSVLVQGAAGGVGSLAVQIAKALGAGFVVGTASSEERRAFVRDLGADLAIPYDTSEWPQEVLRHTARATPPNDEGPVAERHLRARVLSPPTPNDRRVITLPGEWRPERHHQGECGYGATTEPRSRGAQDARGTPSPRRHRAGSAQLTP
jgi:NADPH:quinone reductase